MPRFNDFYYGTGIGSAKYGNAAPLAFSAEPVTATAVGYDDIALTWTAPTSSASETYVTFRVVRSQNGFPQTESDGFIIYQSSGPPTAPTLNNPFHDTSINQSTGKIQFPLIGGRFVFYRAWVQKSSDSSWVSAGSTYTLLPSPHNLGIGRDSKYVETNSGAGSLIGTDRLAFFDPKTNPFVSSTHQRFMDIFPKTIVSKSNSALDVSNDSYKGQKVNTSGELGLAIVADETSDAFSDENALFPAFMSAFSFTMDEMLTFASLITPDTSVHWSSPSSILLGSQELGMTNDIDSVTTTQRRLLRNAVEIYSTKGTSPGLELYCQSLTGYDAVISETNNLLLSIEDSTFYSPGWETQYDTAVKNNTALPPVGNWISDSTGLSLTITSTEVGTSNSYAENSTNGKYVIDKVYAAKVTPSATNQQISLGTISPIGTGIPVVAGTYYSLSLSYKTAGTSDSITTSFKWFDRAGVLISATTSSASTLTSGSAWTRLNVTPVQAPANARYLGITLKFATTAVVYLDLIQLEKVANGSSSPTPYQEPRGAIVALAPTKINLVKNPSFQTNTSYWTAATNSSITRSTLTGRVVAGYVTLASTASTTISAGTDVMSVSAKESYSASAYVSNSTTAFRLKVVFYDSSASPIGSATYSTAKTPGAGSSWTRLSVSVKAPTNAVTAKLFVESSASVDSGVSVDVDDVQFEAATAATEYFDGTKIDNGAVWSGGTAQLQSGLYSAKSARLQRLQKELVDYVGLGTPFYVTLYGDSLYYRGIA
jgi:hypothetical protein